MIIEIFLFMLLGIIFGIFTGLIPGIHINMVATILFTLIIQEVIEIEFVYVAIFILSIGITHTFIDFIPSLFFGIPSQDTVVSMLPGHKLVSEGRGYEALYLCAIGSLGGVFFLGFVYLISYYFLLPLYEKIFEHIGKILLLILLYFILKEKNLHAFFWTIVIVCLSGGLGLIALNSLYIQNPLFFVFCGMFGVASLFLALFDSTISVSKHEKYEPKFRKEYFLGIVLGGVSAMLCSISPGLGNAQAGTLAVTFLKKVKAEMMLVLLSAINGVNFGLSLLTLYVLDKARNGAILILKNLDISVNLNMLILLIIVMIATSTLSYNLVFPIGHLIIKILNYVSVTYINLVLLVFLFCLAIYLGTLSEFLLFIASFSIGVLCVQVGVRRIHLMSVLLVPIIFVLW